MFNRTKIQTLTTVVAISAAMFFGAPKAAAGDMADQQFSDQLSLAKTQAYQLKEDAWALESYTTRDISNESHATMLNQVTEHINDLTATVDRMKAQAPEAAVWQRSALSHIAPYVDELVANTQAAIVYFNDHTAQVEAAVYPQYDAYLEANARMADSLTDLIEDFVDYGTQRERMESFSE